MRKKIIIEAHTKIKEIYTYYIHTDVCECVDVWIETNAKEEEARERDRKYEIENEIDMMNREDRERTKNKTATFVENLYCVKAIHIVWSGRVHVEALTSKKKSVALSMYNII